MSYKIAIIGLGLMGGSLAYALRGFKDAKVVGTNLHPEVCQQALQKGAVDEAYTDASLAVQDADLVIFCVYAHLIPDLLEKCQGSFKPGAVITDICGVKSHLYQRLLPMLPPETDYVGIHPMAGKERDGFENADPAIFKGSGFIICPLPDTRQQSIELMRQLAEYIGASRVAVTDMQKHDQIIAYTSDLMHIAAACLCIDFHPEMDLTFTAGAFRDSTRVADINARAWTELLLDNRENTLVWLDRYIESIHQLRACLADNDADGLAALLRLAGNNKREMLAR